MSASDDDGWKKANPGLRVAALAGDTMTVADALHRAAEAIRALPDRDLLELLALHRPTRGTR